MRQDYSHKGIMDARDVYKSLAPCRSSKVSASQVREKQMDGDLRGPSGSGKSTFIRCINGLEKDRPGYHSVDGLAIHDYRTKSTISS